MSTTDERPRYRLHKPTTTHQGGRHERGEIIATDGPPNFYFEPVNVPAFQRCIAAKFDPLAWGGPEAKEIAAALKESA
jgi:hypothetical protein